MAKQKTESQTTASAQSPEFPFEKNELDQIRNQQCAQLIDKIIEVLDADESAAMTADVRALKDAE